MKLQGNFHFQMLPVLLSYLRSKCPQDTVDKSRTCVLGYLEKLMICKALVKTASIELMGKKIYVLIQLKLMEITECNQISAFVYPAVM